MRYRQAAMYQCGVCIYPRGSKYPIFEVSGPFDGFLGPESLNIGYLDPLGMYIHIYIYALKGFYIMTLGSMYGPQNGAWTPSQGSLTFFGVVWFVHVSSSGNWTHKVHI